MLDIVTIACTLLVSNIANEGLCKVGQGKVLFYEQDNKFQKTYPLDSCIFREGRNIVINDDLSQSIHKFILVTCHDKKG